MSPGDSQAGQQAGNIWCEAWHENGKASCGCRWSGEGMSNLLEQLTTFSASFPIDFALLWEAESYKWQPCDTGVQPL